MPDTAIPPVIPTVPVTPAVLDALRAIVGDKGLILDEQGKQPFVTDWRGSLVGTAAVVKICGRPPAVRTMRPKSIAVTPW